MKQSFLLFFAKINENGETMNNLMLKICNLLAINVYAVARKVQEILNFYVGPFLVAIGACGAVYMVVMGVQYAKAETADKRAEVKKRIINALIGVLLIIGLGVLAMAVNWAELVKIFGYTVDGNLDEIVLDRT